MLPDEDAVVLFIILEIDMSKNEFLEGSVPFRVVMSVSLSAHVKYNLCSSRFNHSHPSPCTPYLQKRVD
tara:strand:+ start:1241 stop:1447 length:207 start_codon:yes stop_codon:yes gene_type:complete